MSESVSSLPKEHQHTEHEANEPHTADLEATEHQATDHQEEAVDTSWVCGHCQIYNHSTSLQCVNCQQNKDQVLIQQAHHEAHHAEVQDHGGVSPPAGGEIQQPENNGMAASHWMPGPGAPLPHLEMMPNAGPHDGTWSCTKCGRANLETKARCSSCQGWKNGERQNMGRKKDPDSGIPLESWACHGCNNMNGPRKVRCSSCQKWKGGKRKLDFRYGPARINPPPESQEPWTCDRCANINEATKVRCCACPRWKDGKRPKKIIPQFAPPVGASLPAYTGADGAVDAFTGQVEQPIPLPNWTCHGCATSNLGKKARCSSCQKWKGGKRENLPWKTNPVIGMIGIVPPTIPPMAPVQLPWTCDACSHPNNGTKARCGSCQRWKGGKRTNLPSRKSNDNAGEKKDWKLPKVWEFPSEGTSVQPNTPWKCTKCGTDNNPTKLRCAGCQSWKNGRRQLLARGAPVGAGVPLNSLVPVAPTAPHFALQPTSTDPWLCSCGHQNAPTKLRCGSCQGWKNGKRNMHNNQAHQQTPPGLPQMHAAGPNIPQLPWNCHKCGKSNLATKSRCGSCQGWRGGTRQNLKQKSAEIWTCHGCERENAGNKVRCGGCQRWRGGGRPDVAARKAEKLANPHNHWTCDNCAKSNKSSKVRCGNCQRWRGGTRPGMRKKNLAVVGQYQVPPSMPAYSTQAPAVSIAGATDTHQIQATNQAAMAAQGESILASSHAKMEAVVGPPPSNLTAEAAEAPVANNQHKTNDGSWTCDKCTCDNLASETRCKICEALKPGTKQSTV